MTDQQTWRVFGQQLRQARVHRGWSQLDLERVLGVAQPVISRDERGHSRPITQERLWQYVELYSWNLAKVEDFLRDDQQSVAILSARAAFIHMMMTIAPEVQNEPERKILMDAVGRIVGERFGVPSSTIDRPVDHHEVRAWRRQQGQSTQGDGGDAEESGTS